MNSIKSTQPRSQPTNRHRKIGRKVLLADRLSRVLDTKKRPFYIRYIDMIQAKPKIAAGVSVAIVMIVGLSFGGIHMFSNRVASVQKAEAVVQQEKLKALSIEADACRRKKVEQKADQIGTLTYDQLYDYGECDR